MILSGSNQRNVLPNASPASQRSRNNHSLPRDTTPASDHAVPAAFRSLIARCFSPTGTVLPKGRNLTTSSQQDLFKYTSGRWIYNEDIRFGERYLEFDIEALRNAVASSISRPPADIVSFLKLSEGGFNRLFQVTFNDGRHVIARIPYPATVPDHYTVASEVATLDYLRLQGFATPEVYASCSTKANPVGAECIIMEKLAGIPLGNIWYTMTPKQQHGIMKQIVEWETRLMSLNFPASVSIYYRKDIPGEKSIPLSDYSDREFCIGPMAHYGWWHEERAKPPIDRGPWLSSNDIFCAVGNRELEWTKCHAKPRLPYERLYREIHGFRQSLPDDHIRNLSDYLKLAHCLGFKQQSPLNRPVIRHPDFQPNNILISETNEVVGFIDWQHATVLPLGLAAGIPKHFQNYGDPESERLAQPQVSFPLDYDSLPSAEQNAIRETLRKRMIHFLYAALTKRYNKEHYDAIFDQSVILHQRLHKAAGTPWEGNSITLHAELIRAVQSWSTLVPEDSVGSGDGKCAVPPLEYPDTGVRDVLELDAQQKEADTALEQMQDAVGVDVLGWVPNDYYETARDTAREIKAQMLKAADTDHDATAVRNHFPFDDFDENS
ncbi:kinase-like domain-containing protein [Aspergillus crustosus]